MAGGLLDKKNQNGVPGRNGKHGDDTSSKTFTINEGQKNALEDFWHGLEDKGTKYSYGGKTIHPGSTFCTEAVVDALLAANIPTLEQETLLTTPQDKWSDDYPSTETGPVVEKLREIFGNYTVISPNSIDEILPQL